MTLGQPKAAFIAVELATAQLKAAARTPRDWTGVTALTVSDTDCFPLSCVLPTIFPPVSFVPRCYRCHCSPQFDGPDCQQTGLRFLGNGYAWLPPVRPCFDSHLSLEFLTEEDDGLLLYAGPLATLLPGDDEDFIAIGK